MRLTLLLSLALAITNVFAETDVVTFANGNKLVGEIKRMERGKLYFDNDSTGIIQIDWDDVDTLISEQNLQFEFTDGTRILGTLEQSQQRGSLAIDSLADSLNMPHEQVVIIHPIESGFKERFDIAVRAGYNYTKGSDVGQFNLGMDVEYRTEKRLASMDLSTIVTDNGGVTTEREDLTFAYRVLRQNRWFTGGVFKLQKNEELDIDLRTSIGGGIGRIIRETSNNRIELTGGLLLNEENLTTAGESDTTLEGLVSMNYDWFRFDTPELDIKSTLAVFPGITDSGRVRAEFDLRFRWEMVEDLFWEMEYYNNYDSGREADTESISDYGIITSLGYKF